MRPALLPQVLMTRRIDVHNSEISSYLVKDLSSFHDTSDLLTLLTSAVVRVDRPGDFWQTLPAIRLIAFNSSGGY